MAKKSPYLSIIIPYCNRAALLHRPLQSICPCKGLRMEVILVDNGSTDEGPEMAAAYAASMEDERDTDVILLDCPDGQACTARNAGLRAASGTWVYFFDSDDVFDEQFLPDFLAFSQLHPNDDLIALRTSMLMPDGTVKDRATLYDPSPSVQILSAELGTQCMVFRREFLLRIGGWCEHLPRWNDWELGFRALLHTPTMHWMKGRAYHRLVQHTDSLTGKDATTTLEHTLPALEKVEHEIACLASAQKESHQTSYMPNTLTKEPANHMFRALAAREAILAGVLQKEGSHTLSDRMMTRALATLYLCQSRTPLIYIRSILWRGWLKMLRNYTATGGRGAWRMALSLTKWT